MKKKSKGQANEKGYINEATEKIDEFDIRMDIAGKNEIIYTEKERIRRWKKVEEKERCKNKRMEKREEGEGKEEREGNTQTEESNRERDEKASTAVCRGGEGARDRGVGTDTEREREWKCRGIWESGDE